MKGIKSFINWVISLFKKKKHEVIKVLDNDEEFMRYERQRQINAKYLARYSGKRRYTPTGANHK